MSTPELNLDPVSAELYLYCEPKGFHIDDQLLIDILVGLMDLKLLRYAEGFDIKALERSFRQTGRLEQHLDPSQKKILETRRKVLGYIVAPMKDAWHAIRINYLLPLTENSDDNFHQAFEEEVKSYWSDGNYVITYDRGKRDQLRKTVNDPIVKKFLILQAMHNKSKTINIETNMDLAALSASPSEKIIESLSTTTSQETKSAGVSEKDALTQQASSTWKGKGNAGKSCGDERKVDTPRKNDHQGAPMVDANNSRKKSPNVPNGGSTSNERSEKEQKLSTLKENRNERSKAPDIGVKKSASKSIEHVLDDSVAVKSELKLSLEDDELHGSHCSARTNGDAEKKKKKKSKVSKRQSKMTGEAHVLDQDQFNDQREASSFPQAGSKSTTSDLNGSRIRQQSPSEKSNLRDSSKVSIIPPKPISKDRDYAVPEEVTSTQEFKLTQDLAAELWEDSPRSQENAEWIPVVGKRHAAKNAKLETESRSRSDFQAQSYQAKSGSGSASRGSQKSPGLLHIITNTQQQYKSEFRVIDKEPHRTERVQVKSASNSGAVHPRVINSKVVGSKAVRSESVNVTHTISRAVDFHEDQPNPADPKAVTSKGTESKAVESKPAKSKAVESKAVESKGIEPKAIESKTIESKAIESKAIESKPIEPNTVESNNVGLKSVSTTAVEFNSVTSKTSDLMAMVPKTASSKAVGNPGSTDLPVLTIDAVSSQISSIQEPDLKETSQIPARDSSRGEPGIDSTIAIVDTTSKTSWPPIISFPVQEVGLETSSTLSEEMNPPHQGSTDAALSKRTIVVQLPPSQSSDLVVSTQKFLGSESSPNSIVQSSEKADISETISNPVNKHRRNSKSVDLGRATHSPDEKMTVAKVLLRDETSPKDLETAKQEHLVAARNLAGDTKAQKAAATRQRKKSIDILRRRTSSLVERTEQTRQVPEASAVVPVTTLPATNIAREDLTSNANHILAIEVVNRLLPPHRVAVRPSKEAPPSYFDTPNPLCQVLYRPRRCSEGGQPLSAASELKVTSSAASSPLYMAYHNSPQPLNFPNPSHQTETSSTSVVYAGYYYPPFTSNGPEIDQISGFSTAQQLTPHRELNSYGSSIEAQYIYGEAAVTLAREETMDPSQIRGSRAEPNIVRNRPYFNHSLYGNGRYDMGGRGISEEGRFLQKTTHIAHGSHSAPMMSSHSRMTGSQATTFASEFDPLDYQAHQQMPWGANLAYLYPENRLGSHEQQSVPLQVYNLGNRAVSGTSQVPRTSFSRTNVQGNLPRIHQSSSNEASYPATSMYNSNRAPAETAGTLPAGELPLSNRLIPDQPQRVNGLRCNFCHTDVFDDEAFYGKCFICPGCGPLAHIRYCSKEHLLANVELHYNTCGTTGSYLMNWNVPNNYFGPSVPYVKAASHLSMELYRQLAYVKILSHEATNIGNVLKSYIDAYHHVVDPAAILFEESTADYVIFKSTGLHDPVPGSLLIRTFHDTLYSVCFEEHQRSHFSRVFKAAAFTGHPDLITFVYKALRQQIDTKRGLIYSTLRLQLKNQISAEFPTFNFNTVSLTDILSWNFSAEFNKLKPEILSLESKNLILRV